jgi:hypothetical protein
VPINLDPVASQDPEYLAFMRGAGYSEAEVLAELARKQGSLQRQLERSAPRFADELRTAEQGVEQDFTNRGLYRSGARMSKQVDVGNVVRRNEQEFRFGIADQQGDMNSAAMRDLADQRRQAADYALRSRQLIAEENANNQPANMPTSHNLGPEPGGGGGGYPGAPKPPQRTNQQNRTYNAFRRRALGGKVSPTSTRGPSAY